MRPARRTAALTPARCGYFAVHWWLARRNLQLKILEWDGDGFWLYFKRLEKGRFRWPSVGETETMTLSTEELCVLLGGAKIELKLQRKKVVERRAI